MENENRNKLIYSNEKVYNSNYSYNPPCTCCNCRSSFCYCNCQCNCHKNKYKENIDIDFENGPNLNINELKMKYIKDYSIKNNQNINDNFHPSFNNLNPSNNNISNNENYNNNGKYLCSLKKKIENNLGKIKTSLMNKSQEVNYISNQKNIKSLTNKINHRNDNNDLNFKEVASHYKTQSNFNTLKKYYQLNNNINNNNNINKNDNVTYNNNSLKSQIEFNKLLNSIKGIDNNININDIHKNYNIFTERENRHYNKINGHDVSSIMSSNNSLAQDIQQLNNGLRNTVNYDRNNRMLEKYKKHNSSNFYEFCSNTEYDKPFRSINIDNENFLNINDKNINYNNNTSIQISSDNYINYSSRESLLDNNNINQNGGNKYKEYVNPSKKSSQNLSNLKLEDDSILYNTSTLNKSYNKLVQNLDSNSNNYSNINLSNTEPRYSNSSKNSDNDNMKIKFNCLDINSPHNDNENKNELLESKDINGDINNNFVVTFGAKGNSEIKNIITSIKNEINSPSNNVSNNKANGNGNENTDQKINNIIIDYENLKKRYEPNKLFVGLQNNIKDLNENINIDITNENYSNKSTINTIKNNNNYTKYKFDILIKGDSNKNKNIILENENYKKEINSLNKELKESKNKIDELNNIISNYQKEIQSLKDQMTRLSKRDSVNESKNTINSISISNNNINTSHKSNKTKIGKDSFIIKIPENLIKNNNRERKSRNNSLSNIIKTKNTNNYSNITLNTNQSIKDKFIKINNNYSNINNNNISNINNNNISNCFTYNNVSIDNITNNNMNNNNEIYVKKITTTMKKKIKKSASQKLRVNKIYNNLSLNCINQDIYTKNIDYSSRHNKFFNKNNNKLIYTLISNDNKLKILSFDIFKKQFELINIFDSDNFMLNYSESCNKQNNNNILNNNSIFLFNNNNDFYTVTGKNNDILYKYNNNNKTMNKLCNFKNNHARGCLLYFENKIFCLSGYHNKKVEMFSEINNTLISLDEMNIERSNFSLSIFQNKYIFALFGYNYPTHQCLDTIEYYDLNNITNFKNNIDGGYGWKYLKYKNNHFLDLNIEGHICFNSNNEKIIFFGGFNGNKNESIDCFYELIINTDNLGIEQNNKGNYVEKINKNLNNIYKNKCYFFGNNNGLMFEENNYLFFTAFDSNFHTHIIQINNLSHNVYYFK